MKKPQMTFPFLAALALGTLMQLSCEKETTDLVAPPDLTAIDTADLLRADEGDWITEEIVNIGEEVYAMAEVPEAW